MLAAAPAALRIGPLALPAAGWGGFTFPRYAPLLQAADDAARERMAVGAWLDGRPVGLVLLSRPLRAASAGDEAARDQRRLLSVLVHPAWRRVGIGSRLLARAQDLSAGNGTVTLWTLYSDRVRARPALEALLRRAGWSAPQLHEMRLAGRARWALRAGQDWGRFLGRLQEQGYASTPWNELAPADHEQIVRLVAALPPQEQGFDPQRPLPDMIPQLSIVLRRGPEVVGWIRGAQGALPGSVYYCDGYAVPQLRRLGWLVAGVRDVSERQAGLQGEDSLCVFETAADNLAMQRFMERQLRPYSEWVDRRYRASVTLS